MKKLVIAIDCDDVLVDTAKYVVEQYNIRHGTQLTLAEYYSDDLHVWGVATRAQATKRVRDIVLEQNRNPEPPSTATIRTIHELAKQHELHLVTGRDDMFSEATHQLVERYFKGCFASIEHTNHFDEDRRRTKGDVCRVIGADVLVDDHVEHIHSVLACGMNEVIVFGNYPWNQTILPVGSVRCADWKAVAAEVSRIAVS